MRESKWNIYLLAVIAASIFLLLTTPFGLGLTPDSVAYLQVAEQLHKGNGFVDIHGKIVTHWPPLYPLLLSVAGAFSDTILQAARFLNALIIMAVVVAFHTLLRHFGISFRIAMAFTVLLLVSEPFTVFMMSWSEGLFILLTILSVLTFYKWHTRKNNHLLLAGLFSGLSLLIRYAGAGFTGGYIFYLLFLYGKPFRKKIHGFIRFSLPVIGLMAIWFIYSHAEGGPARILVWHPMSFAELGKMLTTILEWFTPNTTFKILAAGILLFIAFSNRYFKGLLTRRIPVVNPQRGQIVFITTLVLTYVALLMVSKLWFDAYTPLDTRILSPIFPFLLLLLGVFVQSLFSVKGKQSIVYVSILFLFLAFIKGSSSHWIAHYQKGSGYTAQIWQQSETLKFVKKVETTHIYSNGYEIIPLYSESDVTELPAHIDPVTMKKKNAYREEMRQMEEAVKNEKAVLIYFDNISWRWYLASRDEILNNFEDQQIIYFEDGFIISQS